MAEMRNKVLVFGFILLLLGAFSFWLYSQTRAPEIQAKQATLRVTKNTTLFGVIENLFEKGYIKNRTAFKIALLFSRDTTPAGKDGAIKVGFNTIDQETVYIISKSMNAWKMAYVLLNRAKPFDGSHGAPEGVIWEGGNTFRPVGTLKGKLTIAPLCPIEPCPTQTRNPYSDLQLTLKGESITQYPRLNSEGTFELEVPAGKYTLTLEPCNWLGCKNQFPKEIVIEENKTTNLEINIDTGIR